MSAQIALEREHRARWGPICGVLFVVFLVVSFLILKTPSTSKSSQYILNWYSSTSHKRLVNIDTVLSNIAVVFGMFWFGYLRDRFGRTDLGARLSPIFLAGAILFAGGGLAFSGVQFALTDDPKKMDPATAQTLNFLGSDLGAAGLVVGVSIVMWAAGFIILKTKVLPSWVAWLSFVLAVASLAGPIGFLAFFVTGIWILIVAFFMWRFEMSLPVSAEGVDAPAAVPSGSSG